MKNESTNITATFTNKQTGQRWYLSENRRFKVRLDDSSAALIIEDGVDPYKMIDGRIFNDRSKRDITEGWHAEKYLLPLVESARRAEAQLAAAGK